MNILINLLIIIKYIKINKIIYKRFLCFENEIDDAAKKAIMDNGNNAAHKAKIADVDPKDVKP